MKRVYTYIFITLAVAFACLSCEEKTAMITDPNAVTDLLEVPEEAVEVESGQGMYTIEVLSRYDYTTESDVDWLTCDRSSSRYLILNVQENLTTKERVGNIKVTIRDEHFDVEYSKTFQVKQVGGRATLDAYFIQYDWYGGEEHVSNYSLYDSFGGQVQLYIKSNTEYTISSDCNWIVWEKSDDLSNEDRDVFLLTIKRNDTVDIEGNMRVGHIYVTAEDVISAITINQSPFLPSIFISTQSREFNLSPAATTSKIVFYANSSWKASCDADWITLSNSEEIFNNQAADKDCVLSFSAQANGSAEERSATITIESADSSYGQKCTITVNQKGMFEVSDARLQYMGNGLLDSYDIDLTAQVDWVASCDATWLTVTASGTSSDTSISLRVTTNNSNEIREAVVTISSAEDSNLYTTFKVTQDHINTIYYYSTSINKYYINNLSFGGANIVEHIIDADTHLARVLFDGEVTTVEKKESATSFYSGWGYYVTTVILPPTVTTIGTYAFTNCDALTRIELPASVTSIAKEAVSGCRNLTHIFCNATNPPAGADGMFDISSDCKIYVPANSAGAYRTAEYWSNYSEQIVGASQVMPLY